MRRTELNGLEPAPFRGFDRSTFWPFRPRLKSLDVADDFTDVRRQMRDQCPSRPGVYGMIDAHGQLIYVGVSTALRKRLITYFQGGDAVRKECAIAAHAERLVWETVGHPLVAQLRELELIRAHQPRFNVQGRDRVRPLGHLYISAEPAPRLRIGRRIPRAAHHTWGPLKINWQIREAVEIVNRLFKLCDCPSATPMHFADQRNLFSLDLRLQCLRGEIGTCLGPCAGRCTRQEYAAQIRAARAFLDGRDAKVITTLEDQLHQAIQELQFERAAHLHETLERLRFLTNRLQLLREPPLPRQIVYPVEVRRHTAWLLIAAGEVAAATRPPTDRKSTARCRQLIQRVFENEQQPERAEPDRPAAAIVATWFRKHPAELQKAFAPSACFT